MEDTKGMALVKSLNKRYKEIDGYNVYGWTIDSLEPLTMRCTVRSKSYFDTLPELEVKGYKQYRAFCVEDEDRNTRFYFKFNEV